MPAPNQSRPKGYKGTWPPPDNRGKGPGPRSQSGRPQSRRDSASSGDLPPMARSRYQELRQSMADSPNKSYGGTRGDSAVMNWALSAAAMASAGVVAGFSYVFLQAYARTDGAGPQDFKLSYYACQALFVLSILTAALLALYVIWVFVDARHPMRKAWLTASDQRNGRVTTAKGKPVRWPGLTSGSFEGVSRITTHSLYAERAHIRKMLMFYGILFVLWCVPFLMTTLADGYITWRDEKNQGVKVAEVCGIKKSRDLCLHLARAGIASGVVTFLLLLSVIVTTISLVARPVFSMTTSK